MSYYSGFLCRLLVGVSLLVMLVFPCQVLGADTSCDVSTQGCTVQLTLTGTRGAEQATVQFGGITATLLVPEGFGSRYHLASLFVTPTQDGVAVMGLSPNGATVDPFLTYAQQGQIDLVRLLPTVQFAGPAGRYTVLHRDLATGRLLATPATTLGALDGSSLFVVRPAIRGEHGQVSWPARLLWTADVVMTSKVCRTTVIVAPKATPTPRPVHRPKATPTPRPVHRPKATSTPSSHLQTKPTHHPRKTPAPTPTPHSLLLFAEHNNAAQRTPTPMPGLHKATSKMRPQPTPTPAPGASATHGHVVASSRPALSPTPQVKQRTIQTCTTTTQRSRQATPVPFPISLTHSAAHALVTVTVVLPDGRNYSVQGHTNDGGAWSGIVTIPPPTALHTGTVQTALVSMTLERYGQENGHSGTLELQE